MTVHVEKEAINAREELNKARGLPVRYTQQQFWFTGDGSATDFVMPQGWKPLHVFNAGLLQKEGSSDDYETISDGTSYTVSFGTAPANLNDIGVIATT